MKKGSKEIEVDGDKVGGKEVIQRRDETRVVGMRVGMVERQRGG